jgi:predicted kinase
LLSGRARVGAQYRANSDQLALARRYVAAACAHLAPPPARLAAVGGRSGSGKSSLARAIAPVLGPAPGAVILRSDEIRKRQAGLRPAERAPAEAYRPEADRAVFDELFDLAGRLLGAGRAVVLDATFLKPELRDRAEGLAAVGGVAFDGLWLDAPAEVLSARVAGRRGDASDAGLAVLQAQLASDEGPMRWARLDARPPASATAQAWLSRTRA